jgi:hypothetical protein
MRMLRLVAVNVAVVAGIVMVIESVAALTAYRVGLPIPAALAERRHTQYDALLGWVNTPNTDVPDMYGPGVRLHINRQGFRSDRDFAREVPGGKLRAICSGDSFTLGYGVDNAHTWCELLTTLDPRLETVNMGQGGYGADQAYLWYKRDGAALSHQLTIFAFIGDDLPRMSAAAFSGYAKPRLAIENGALRVTGVPVPGPANPQVRRWLERARRLRTVRAFNLLREKAGLGSRETADLTIDETQQLIAVMLADLRALAEQRSSRLVLVFLPTELDLEDADTDWVPPVAARARALNIPYIDLTADFAAVPAAERAGLFIKKGQLDYPGAEGHYTVAGNELVAHALHRELRPYLPQ